MIRLIRGRVLLVAYLANGSYGQAIVFESKNPIWFYRTLISYSKLSLGRVPKVIN